MIIDDTTHILVKTGDAERRKVLGHILGHLALGPGKKLADLGAGHCLFSETAAAHGYLVTATDAREDRKPAQLPPNVTFRLNDVRTFDLSGFDVILILGLLYHLTLDDQIALLTRCPIGSRVIIDTQVHIRHLVVQDLWDKMNLDPDAIVTEAGYEGILFREQSNLQASVGNAHSWWHTEPSILRMFEATGFSECALVGPPAVSKYGGRRWYVLSKHA